MTDSHPPFFSSGLRSRLAFVLLVAVTPVLGQAPAQPTHPQRPPMPTRDPRTPGFVAATELPDGSVLPATVNGNFILGPTHDPAPEITAALQMGEDRLVSGTVIEFTMNSSD